MKLSNLIARLTMEERPRIRRDADPEVTAICYDSRRVQPGAVFVAMEGFKVDGHRYIDEAVARGAVAVVCRRWASAGVLVIRVPDPRVALAQLACRFYGRPADEMCLVGVTGTNGKTTVTYLLERILMAAGQRPGVVGTINYRYGDEVVANPVTTPESLDLQAILRRMADAGTTHVVMETSSHALELHRVEGCRFDAAVFTNLTQDHLDFHGTMARYWSAKQRLFTEYLKPVDRSRPVRCVVNADDRHGRELIRRLGAGVLRTASRGAGDIRPLGVTSDLAGIRGVLATPAGEIPVASPFVGAFSLENILSAVGAALVLGIAPEAIASGIAATAPVPGRLERVSNGPRTVFVDYAHTPDALENAIRALRALTPGRLLTVFGCGGDRDAGKRPIMGDIAVRLSDLAIVTSDNPRSEPPMAIIDQVEAGIHRTGAPRLSAGVLKNGWRGPAYVVEPDRAAAIALAIGATGEADVVLIAGKGHETYQILADETIHFDDREVARQVLATLAAAGG